MPRSIHVFFLILVLHVLESALANKFSLFSHADECSLLFQFKESMSINKSASGDSRAYPKVSSWNLNNSDGEKSCCLWDGVECRFGHVIGLDLSSSFLYGPIYSNNSLFNLIHLRTLNLADNDFDSSQIPSEIGRLSQLANLDLSYSGLSGEVPKQISQLRNLVSLDLSSTYRLKMQRSDIQNLVQNSYETLRELFLSSVNINSELPASIGNLTHLNILDLDGCGFTGTLPASITQLDLYDVNLYGEIPSSFFNLTQVESLDLSINQLKGELSSSWLNFQNLESFYLDDNNVTANLYLFLSLKKLKTLDLSGNNITLSVIVIDSHKNGTQPQFIFIRLESCNLKVFPEFLRFQHQLEKLILDYNNIEGLIPGWMWNISTETQTELTLSHNLLMGFEQHSLVAPWVRLQTLELSHNMLHGEILMPPPTTEYFSVSNNNLTGGIPPSICDLLSLQLLDLSFNNIIGSIPPCLEKLSNSSLTVLNLRGNTLHGTIPNIFANGSMLQFIDLSENILEGQVPRSLEDCKSLRFLDLGYNFIEDLFPSWLGVLLELQVFILRFNKFHGIIRIPSKIKVNFPALGIIDLSYNSFYGDLPHQYFLEWLAMTETKANANYMETYVDVAEIYRPISFSLQMTSKGVKLEYVKILNAFFAVDFSSNMFSGKIPESVKTLTGLQLLNLSNNELSGVIPPSMGNLIRLEALDLSSNKLSGMIPQDLVQLNFLAFLNVSNNNLTGPIP
ncbi:putative leucine-rich repeat-containing, plant-type, leucine-rich repeat domain superfamily [Helianthus annuus]|uniref:Leucine-rich repeat-containing, plant-type, leucine-rich repeat domain superfamily n=2 Tax=Helianthus annuus TaxID=4232 RepID=A0A251S4R2_HELAN|nr:putative leucine-rich repeat-containing, plant-type, leucine-rich repeat domain superfamily [Helianthus annuus]KAJ0449742.1 putative leucine-rich repeat-containing, plant-type, leucine-rich repeat domain superfamily [Helianthus annuus]KAJ0471444.1 putative leucine-rich repeat-containing, plant-type, leucine-rich repeat domain superfamily [Helianthus annuus]